jgi:hypothetical protein
MNAGRDENDDLATFARSVGRGLAEGQDLDPNRSAAV